MTRDESNLYRTVLGESINQLDQLQCENPMQLVRLIKIKRELAALLVDIPVYKEVDDNDLMDLDSFFDDFNSI